MRTAEMKSVVWTVSRDIDYSSDTTRNRVRKGNRVDITIFYSED